MTSYNYAFDNPLRLTDPTGLAPTDWYRDGEGNIVYDEDVQSQADLKEGQTYLGENVLQYKEEGPTRLGTREGDWVDVFDESMTEGEAGAKGASGASVAASGQGGVLSLTEKGGKALSRLKVSTKAFGYVGTLAAFGLSSGSEGIEFLGGDDRFGVYERVKVGTDAFITVGEVSLTAFGGPLGDVIGATGGFAAQTTGLKSWADRQITLQILEARVDEVVE
jgi:hypothetical protein